MSGEPGSEPTGAVPLPTPDVLIARVDRIHERIAAARAASPRRAAPEVRLVAVTKGHPPGVVDLALGAGLVDLGESYAQELLTKAGERAVAAGGQEPQLPVAASEPRWHFVGHLQRNKVRQLAGLVRLWQSVDRSSLGSEVAKRAPGAAVLVELNLAGDPARPGTSFEEAPALVAELVGMGLEVRGFMGVAPRGTPEDARPGFRSLVELADRLGLPERSIGMSGDLEVAVEEGATMVRVGTALFGARRRQGLLP